MAGGNYHKILLTDHQQFYSDPMALIDPQALLNTSCPIGPGIIQLDNSFDARLRYTDRFIDNIVDILEDFIQNIAENHLDEETIADIEAQINMPKIKGKLKEYINFRLNKC